MCARGLSLMGRGRIDCAEGRVMFVWRVRAAGGLGGRTVVGMRRVDLGLGLENSSARCVYPYLKRAVDSLCWVV